jgi:hypothetical protein
MNDDSSNEIQAKKIKILWSSCGRRRRKYWSHQTKPVDDILKIVAAMMQYSSLLVHEFERLVTDTSKKI